MRKFIGATASIAAAVAVAGCAKSQMFPEYLVSGRGETAAPRVTGPTRVATATAPSGRITTVDAKYRFVIIDFSAGTMPSLGAHLKVYRAGREVGTVRVTEPIRPPFASADIVAGEAGRGDVVR
jgi:hypothetical protein